MSINRDGFSQYAVNLDSDLINVEDIDEVRGGISSVVGKIFRCGKIDINEFKRLVEAALAGTDNYEFLKLLDYSTNNAWNDDESPVKFKWMCERFLEDIEYYSNNRQDWERT